MKKRVLMFARGVGEYTEVLTNAKLLKVKYQIFIVRDFLLNTPGKEEFEIKARKEGFKCFTVHPFEKHIFFSSNKKRSLWQRFKRKIRSYRLKRRLKLDVLERKLLSEDAKGFYKVFGSLLAPFYNYRRGFLKPLRTLKKRRKRFIKVLNKVKPDILILNNANGSTYSEIYINECRKRNIPSILIPFTYVFPIAPAKVVYNNKAYSVKGWRKLVMEKFFRRWLKPFRNKLLTRVPFGVALGHKLLGIEPPLPWVQDSSTCKYILAESEFLRDHYIDLGIPPEQIKLTGKPNMDYLFKLSKKSESLRAKIIKEHKFPKRKPIITVAIPPAIDVYSKKQFKVEFRNHDEIFKYLVEKVSKIKTHSIILSLHPSLRNNPQDVKRYESYQKKNVRISNRSTAEMIAASDMYIASASGTIIWALALGVAVMDYDVLGLGFSYFDKNPDVITPKNKSAFQKEIRRLSTKPAFIKEIRKKLEKKKGYYGILDGKCTKRIDDIITELTAKKATAA